MNHDNQAIQIIVDRVLQELQRSSVDAPKANGRLVLEQKVVSLELLQNRLSGIDTVQVVRRAIVTPAVRDLLKEKNIRLSHGEGKCSCGCKTCKIVHFAATGAISLTNRDVKSTRTIRQTIAHVAGLVRKGSGVVLVVDNPHSFQVILNRNPIIRASIVETKDDLAQAIANISINVAIIDNRQMDQETIENIAIAFDQKPREIPIEYKEFV